MEQNKRDLTSGSLAGQILCFSVPLMLSNVLQILFNMVDVAVVGRFAGSMALGSVGSTTTMINMFTGFLIGLAGGINVLTARFLGARDRKNLREAVHTAAVFSLLTGILLLAVGIGLGRWILVLLHTRTELMDGAVLYISIYFLGMPALAVYNFGNAVFSAAGDTRRPLYYLSAAGVVNIVLNLILVIVFHMDVAGVAIASVIAQYLSAVLIAAALFRSREEYGLCLSELRIHPVKLKAIVHIGIPAGLQNIIFHFANMCIQAAVNSFSAVMVAGNAAAANADGLVFDIMAAFYTACGSFMGQNYGAGNRERVRKSYLWSLSYSFGVGALAGGLFLLFGKQFLSLFTGDQEVAAAGMQRLQIMGFSYAMSAVMDCSISASRALGKSVVPTIIVLLGSCVFRVIWIYTVFAWFRTIPSLYLLYIFSWSITGLAEVIYFIKIYQKQMETIPG